MSAHQVHLKLILAVMFLVVAPALSAQPTADLNHKFGPPDERGFYIVRKGVRLRVSTEKEKVRELVIEPDDAKSEVASSFMPAAWVNEIVAELAPVSLRGKYIRSIVFYAGISSIAVEEYEHVTICTSWIDREGNGGITSAGIRWLAHQQFAAGFAKI